jgi:chromosome segregation ATPase
MSFTQEQLDAAVAAAVAPLKEQISTFEAKASNEEVEAKIAELKTESDTKIAELQAKLDSAVLEASEAKKTVEDTTAYLEAVKAEADAAAELASKKETRLTLVRDAANFPDEYIEANADRWASLDDTAFEALVNDWRAIAKREEGQSNAPAAEKLLASTAMVASREDKGTKSAVSSLFELAANGADLKRI